MKKSPLIPKSKGAAEARKMLIVLNRSFLPAKPKLIAALPLLIVAIIRTDEEGGSSDTITSGESYNLPD